jgi:hypothetical protein
MSFFATRPIINKSRSVRCVFVVGKVMGVSER